MIKKFHDCKGHRVLSHHSEGRSWHRSLQKNHYFPMVMSGFRMMMIMMIMDWWLQLLAHLVQGGGLWGGCVAWHPRQNHRPPVNIRPENYYHYYHYQYHLHRRLLIKAILSEKCLKRTKLHYFAYLQYIYFIYAICRFHFSISAKGANGPRGKCQCGGLQEFARIFGDFGATGLIWATQPLLRHLLFKTIRWDL